MSQPLSRAASPALVMQSYALAPTTRWWISLLSSWIASVRSVLAFSATARFASTCAICCSWAVIRASVASRFRSERLEDAPTRNPIYSSAIVVTVLRGKLNPFEVNHAGRKL